MSQQPGISQQPGMSQQPRITALDVLRGFALCGILVVNVRPIANVDADVLSHAVGADWPGYLADQRFFPIFSLLFGVGFSLMLKTAANRTDRPRLVLLRRLLALLAIGLLHMFLLWRGDILTIYAVVGLVVLLPSTWLPRWAVAVLAGVLLVVPPALGTNGVVLVPGLFLLGSLLTRYGVTERLERMTWWPATLVFAVLAVPAAWAQSNQVYSAFAVAGLLTAGVYVCGMLALFRTPLRPALQAIFAPLGRMALTNYLSATVLVLLISAVLGGKPDTWSEGTVLLIAAGILAVQRVLSGLWLRHFRYGPVEWLWRYATWLRRPSGERREAPAYNSPSSPSGFVQ
ncbi:DUF418 domain-containing protein [[Actinomadura] parvosata]|uniref:DUF418 domain-containing protein n=1 Tax=[Actinomadura] parvosata TaxID=1955412 RepID=UPI00406CDEEF